MVRVRPCYLSPLVFVVIYYLSIYSLVHKSRYTKVDKKVYLPLPTVKREEEYHGRNNPRLQFARELEQNILSARRDKVHWEHLSLHNLTLPAPLPGVRSPCWWTDHSPKNSCPRFTGSRRVLKEPETSGKVLRCLPFFYLIGQAKSGTTDLFYKITEHPDIVRPTIKEPFWLMPVRFHNECASIDVYLDHYKSVASEIQKDLKRNMKSRLITGDGSTTTMSGNAWWPLLPGNEKCSEPCVTHADMIRNINPGAKLLVILRNPTDRCFSYYIMKAPILQYEVSKQHFHSLVANEIEEFKRCRMSSSLRACVYNVDQENYLTTAISLRSSIYHVHLLDWLRVFSRSQLHIVQFEHYKDHVTETLADIYKFLEVEKLSKGHLASISLRNARNQKSRHNSELGDMWPETRAMLDSFFETFNHQLAILLDDDRFEWSGK